MINRTVHSESTKLANYHQPNTQHTNRRRINVTIWENSMNKETKVFNHTGFSP